MRPAVPIRARVIDFPIFESYGDQIAECLSVLGEQKPGRAAVQRVTRLLQCILPGVERVRNSTRHTNMARLMRHTLEALQASEWQGARYLLMTGSALMHARAVRPGVSLNSEEAGGVLQFAAAGGKSESEVITDAATTGTVTG